MCQTTNYGQINCYNKSYSNVKLIQDFFSFLGKVIESRFLIDYSIGSNYNNFTSILQMWYGNKYISMASFLIPYFYAHDNHDLSH